MVQNKVLPRRGRPRAYEPIKALSDAMETFWRGGFSGTSLDDLSEAMGMNRPSLYGAFGDKRALYLSTLDRYVEVANSVIAEALDPAHSLREGLRRAYEIALKFYLPEEGEARGCFLISTAATESVRDEGIRTKLRDALRGFDRALEVRIRLAKEQGELDAKADPTALALMASAVIHSLAVRSRAGDTRATLNAIVEAGLHLICGPQHALSAKTRKRDGLQAKRGRSTR